jgi:quercetin dioxygenase-like cupin family protein
MILRREQREISILVASEGVTITHARCLAGEQVAGPHVHHDHTDAFYVLEGELIFEIGREAKTITVSSGGFVAAPPEVAHSFRNDGDRAARWLTSMRPTAASLLSCAASATASRSSGTSQPCPPAAACRQATRSSERETPSRGQWSIRPTQTTVGCASVQECPPSD